LASYLLVGGPDARLAVVMYGASMEGMAISFTLILRHLIREGLLIRPVSPADGRKAVRRFGRGSVLYPLIMIVGLLSPVAMLILYAALTTFYIADRPRSCSRTRINRFASNDPARSGSRTVHRGGRARSPSRQGHWVR
jgi:hypothetical protein